MSREVDDRVVSMEFDNSNFEKNVKTSMSTLDKLKQALNFKGASKGLEAVESASKKVNFSSMSNAVDEVGVRFSGLQVIATTALANITNAAVNAGKQMVGALTIDPIKGGFSEYETQIGAIQTILSNTRHEGTNLDQVNAALDELNTYADKTIYNFTEMTRNIGTFTAAGVGLDQSVAAIKGIANLAAVSGSTSAQASQAMYQLSQALAAGRVSLMDWNSVVNAGMGGKVFQDALVRTSELMGTGAKQAIETYGSFRESLTQGAWLTSDVLTETLKQISGAYTEADLISQGYTQEQAAEIVALAKDAEGAATNVRTFSQLIDTTMEALGSGWTNTWEILVGDFEEAQALFTDISNVINNAVTESANARNDMLQSWKDLGGRDVLIEGIRNAFEALLSVINPIREAFSNIFPPMTAENLLSITEKFRDFTANLKLDTEAADKLRSVFEAIFTVAKTVGQVIGTIASGIFNLIGNASGLIDAIGDFIIGIGDFAGVISESFSDSSKLNEIVMSLSESFGQAASGVGEFLSSGIGKLGEVINSITPDQINTFLNMVATGGFVSLVNNFKDALSDLGSTGESFAGQIGDIIKEMTGGFSESVTGVLDAVRDALISWQQNIKSTILLKIAVAVALLANAVGQLSSIDPGALRDSLGAITVLFGELILVMTAFEKLSLGLNFGFSGASALIGMTIALNLIANAMKSVAGLDEDSITRGVEAIAELATIMVVMAKALSTGEGVALNGAANLVIMTAAIKLLASVVEDLASINFDQMGQGLSGIAVLMGELVMFTRALSGSEGLGTTSLSMIALGAALLILANAVKQLGEIDSGAAMQGISALGVIMVEMAGFSKIANGKTLLSSFLPFIAIAGAMFTLAHALTEIGQLNTEQTTAAVVALISLMTGITAMTRLMPDAKKLNSISGSLPMLATSLVIMAAAIKILSGLKMEDVVTSLAGFGVAIGAIFAALKVVSGNTASLGGLLLAATALTIFAAAINLMSIPGVVGVATALTSLAGTFTIMGVAGALLKPIIPVLFQLAGAVAAFGASLIALGAGSAALGVGLAVTLGAIATAFMTLQEALKNIDPATTAIGVGILAAAFVAMGVSAHFLAPLTPAILSLSLSLASFGLACAAVAVSIGVLVAAFTALGALGADNAGALVETFKTILLGVLDMVPSIITSLFESFKTILSGLLDVIVEMAPDIADSILKVITEVLASLNEYGPQIVDFVLSFLIQIINGVAARIPELVSSISNLIGSLFTSIFDAMAGWSESGDAGKIALTFLGGATGLVVAFNAIKSMIPGAMVGAVEMGAFIVEVGAILAALGALQQIPGVSWLIGEGGNLLQSIGTSLGQFVGGIVGGALEGATSTLPTVGTSLSEFMTNLRPFVQGAMDLDPSILDSITTLTECIALLAGAGFIESITSFITGGADFGGLGEKLVPFGQAVVEFSNTVQGIDVGAVTAAAQCGEALAALASSLPKEGGLAQAIFGENVDMATFGVQLVAFGTAIKAYSVAIAGIDTNAIVQSAQAGQALSELASSLPKEGGLAQAIFGENVDMATFGVQLMAFGMAIKAYGDSVKDINIEAITASAQAGQALSELANSLPDEGGLAQWIFGGSDLGTFGTTLTQFGSALKDYGDSLAEVDFSKIGSSVTAVTNLKNILESFVGIDTSGIENVNLIGDIGTAIGDYYDAISAYDVGALGQSVSTLSGLRDFINSLADINASGISSFSDAITQLGQVSLDGLISVFSTADLSGAGLNLASTFSNGFSQGLGTVTTAVTNMISTVSSSISGQTQSFSTAGLASATAYATGIQNGVPAVTTAVSSMVSNASSAIGNNYSAFYSAGSNLALGFARGISGSAYAAKTAAAAMANAAKEAAEAALGIKSPSRVLKRVGEYTGEGFVNGIAAYNEKARDAGSTMAEFAVQGASSLIGIYDSFGDIGKAIEDISALSKSLSKDKEEDAESSEKDAEANSKLADALSTVADSAQNILDRKNDLEALKQLLSRTGVAFSDAFIAELMNSQGQYAGAISEMIALTDEQLQELNNVYDQTASSDRMNELFDTLSDSIMEITDSKRDLQSIQKILSRTGVTFSKSFVRELKDTSGTYSEVLSEMVNLTNEQLQMISDLFEEQRWAEMVNEFTEALSEDDGLAAAFEALGVNLEDFLKQLDEFGIDISDATDMVSEFAETVSDGFSKMSIDDQTGLKEFTDNLKNNVLVAKDWEQNVKAVFDRVGNYPGSEEFRKEVLEEGFDKYGKIISELANRSAGEIMQVIDLWNSAREIGGEAGFNVLNSLIPGEDQVQEVGTSAASGLTNGLVQGIKDGSANVYDAVSKLCKTANDVAEDYFKTESFGSLTEQLSELMLKLSEGIRTVAQTIISSMEQLAAYVQGALQKAQSISDQINSLSSGAQPVIDATDARNKADLLNSVSGSTPSSSVMNTVEIINANSQNGSGISTLSSMRSSIDNLANKIDSLDTSNAGTFVQNNYSPKALSTATIYRQTKNQISLARSKPYTGNAIQ